MAVQREQRVLILFAHPALQKSRVHRRLVSEVRDLDGVVLHDLYEVYPDFDIDIGREQKLLVEHDVVVLQHPFYWYSIPALLKQWIDLVLEHGWAYGPGGDALRGKRVLTALSAGGELEGYGPEGANRFTVREFLAPIEQTMRLCGMEYLTPFVIHGAHSLDDADLARAAADYRELLAGLRDSANDSTAPEGAMARATAPRR